MGSTKLQNQGRAHEARTLMELMESHDKHDDRANVVDLLANIRHYCDEEGIDFKDASMSSYHHHEAERNGEDQP